MYYFTGDTTKIKPSIITLNYLTTGRLLNLQLRLTRLTGISTQKMILKPKLPNFAIHLDINGTDIFKPVEVAAVSAKHFQSVFITSRLAITMVY